MIIISKGIVNPCSMNTFNLSYMVNTCKIGDSRFCNRQWALLQNFYETTVTLHRKEAYMSKNRLFVTCTQFIYLQKLGIYKNWPIWFLFMKMMGRDHFDEDQVFLITVVWMITTTSTRATMLSRFTIYLTRGTANFLFVKL